MYRPHKAHRSQHTHCGNGTAGTDKWLSALNGRWVEPPKFGEQRMREQKMHAAMI